MAFNPYPTYREELITIHDNYVVDAFSQAATSMSEQGCDSTAFLEIYYQEGKIFRIWDSAEVQVLSQRERLRLFPQLNGLYKLAMNNRLYPL